MGNHQTSTKKKKHPKSASTPVIPAIEVTDHNHFHAVDDGTGNPFEKYIYPFENLVFEGSGNRLLAYCGAIRVLEEAGVWKQIKRLAGSNTGAIIATLLGVGYNSHDLEQFFSENLKLIFADPVLGSCGCCGLFSKISKKYGCNSEKKLGKWIGKKLEAATGTANITFQQVYERFGKEICIAVTNVNQTMTEYCHVKTTPSMPIKLAVCMSLATPGVFQPVKHQQYSTMHHYVDGGLICNYPIHCFDGWWLSLEGKDNFLRRLRPLSDLPRLMDKKCRFANYNEKTLGFVLFSENDLDPLQAILEDREGKLLPTNDISTKLAQRAIPRLLARREAADNYDQFSIAADRFLRVLENAGLYEIDALNKRDLENALKRKNEVTPADLEELFGLDATADDIFKLLNKPNKEWITFGELVNFLEEKSKKLYSKFQETHSRNINDISSYKHSLEETFHCNTRRHFVEKRDLERTVGINTYYIGRGDFKFEQGDIKMLIEQGRRATLSYLLYFVTHRHAPLKTEGQRLSFCPDDSLPYFIDDEVYSEIINENDYAEKFLVIPRH